MCTVVLLYRPDHHWPLLLAGNRDEMYDRPSLPPGPHWPEQPDTVAGLDQLGGGSWMGINRSGVISVVMNRMGTLGPLAGKRSRGELVLNALQHATASQAAQQLLMLHATDYRAFNLIIADRDGCFWVKNSDDPDQEHLAVTEITPGLHMLTAHELDDMDSPRIRSWLATFKQAPIPQPEKQQWHAWQELMGDRTHPTDTGADAAMQVDFANGFGTVSTSFMALPSVDNPANPLWLFVDKPQSNQQLTQIKLT